MANIRFFRPRYLPNLHIKHLITNFYLPNQKLSTLRLGSRVGEEYEERFGEFKSGEMEFGEMTRVGRKGANCCKMAS